MDEQLSLLFPLLLPLLLVEQCLVNLRLSSKAGLIFLRRNQVSEADLRLYADNRQANYGYARVDF